ncbi:uncharacterized protein LOC144121172 [Amblyomma americanum]
MLKTRHAFAETFNRNLASIAGLRHSTVFLICRAFTDVYTSATSAVVRCLREMPILSAEIVRFNVELTRAAYAEGVYGSHDDNRGESIRTHPRPSAKTTSGGT